MGRGGGGLGALLLSRSRYREQGRALGAWSGSVCKEKGLFVGEGVECGSRDGSKSGSSSVSGSRELR